MARGEIVAIPGAEVTPVSGVVLYNYLNCSPRHHTDNRGLALGILNDGYAGFLADHDALVIEAATYGVTLGAVLGNPWGKGGNGTQDYQTLPNGFTTTQRLDQIIKATEAGFTDLSTQILATTEPSSTVLYIGSTPVGTMADNGYTDLIDAGYIFCFDALTTYDADSAMFLEALALFETNHVLAEANKEYKGLPLVAWPLSERNPGWGSSNRVSLEDAPAGSAWWWRTPGNDGPWDYDAVVRALDAGLDLWIRLDQLSDAERTALFELVATYGTTAEFGGYIPTAQSGCSGVIAKLSCSNFYPLSAWAPEQFRFDRFSGSADPFLYGSSAGGPKALIGGDSVTIPPVGPVPQFWTQQGYGNRSSFSGFGGGGFLGGSSGNHHGGSLGSSEFFDITHD